MQVGESDRKPVERWMPVPLPEDMPANDEDEEVESQGVDEVMSLLMAAGVRVKYADDQHTSSQGST